jgi:uncharacterized protein DUF3515
VRTQPRRHPATILIFVLPVLLLAAAVALGLATHGPGPAGQPPASGPLALPPVDAPDAGSPSCARLIAALPAELTSDPHPLPRLPIAAPAPAGTAAWAGAERARPVVLRCGLPRPAELTPTSALIVINGVSWLPLSAPDRDTFISVDRPVYVVLTVPHGLGTGPVQTVSDAVRATLPMR